MIKLCDVPAGSRYTVSAEYKRDFINLQDSFGRLFNSMCETVKLHVQVNDLKRYLSQTFSEFEILQDAITTDDVMKTVRNESSLTDIAYFEQIANHFDLHQMKRKIDDYCKIIDSFCEHTLDNHSYVRSFRKDYHQYLLTSDKIVFQLQWRAKEKTLKDIRDVLQMGFGQLADRVQIVVIQNGSVVAVCWAPRYLMKDLARQASERVKSLTLMGVVKLTVGTEVVIEEVNIFINFRYYIDTYLRLETRSLMRTILVAGVTCTCSFSYTRLQDFSISNHT